VLELATPTVPSWDESVPQNALATPSKAHLHGHAGFRANREMVVWLTGPSACPRDEKAALAVGDGANWAEEGHVPCVETSLSLRAVANFFVNECAQPSGMPRYEQNDPDDRTGHGRNRLGDNVEIELI
jgi:hypothetical protein